MLQRVLFWIGPLAAGFQVATIVLSFFGLGAVASWLIRHWFPFTRWVWGQVLEYVHLPEITDAEKDALTTLVFFLPLGLYALANRREDQRDQKYRVGGLFAGAVFFCIMAYSFILELIIDLSVAVSEHLFITTLYGGVVLFLILIFSLINWMSRRARAERYRPRGSNLGTLDDDIEHGDDDWAATVIRRHRYQLTRALLFAITGMQGLFFTALLALSSADFGFIRISCFYALLLLSLSAMIYSPYRLYVSMGCVVAFVLSGVIFDVAIFAIEAIENVADAPEVLPAG